MKKTRQRILDRLERAQRRGRPVRIERDRVHDGNVRGFVTAVSDRWVALEFLSDSVHPDGLTFVRVKHVTRVRRDPTAGFIERALRDTGPVRARIDLSDETRTRDVLQAAAERGAVVGFFDERYDSSSFFVGRPETCDDDGFDFRYVTPSGHWKQSLERFRYREVTRVDIGSRYLDALATYGDPAPEGA